MLEELKMTWLSYLNSVFRILLKSIWVMPNSEIDLILPVSDSVSSSTTRAFRTVNYSAVVLSSNIETPEKAGAWSAEDDSSSVSSVSSSIWSSTGGILTSNVVTKMFSAPKLSYKVNWILKTPTLPSFMSKKVMVYFVSEYIIQSLRPSMLIVMFSSSCSSSIRSGI